MTRRSFPFVWPLAFFLLALPAIADDAPPPAPPGTLAQALADAETPHEDLYVTVAPEKVLLPSDAVPPRKGDSVKQVAADYDRLVWYYGAVVAVAPPTMTVLNTAPGTPNPYEGMPPGDAFKMLLGSLSDAQWKTLTGEAGLGDSDLSGDTQHALFAAMFPGGTLALSLLHGTGGGAGSNASEDITLNADDLKAVHLRLGQQVQIGLPREDSPSSTLALGNLLAGQNQYYAGTGAVIGQNTLYGVSVRQTVPNTLKKSDLDFDRAALRQKVSLDGVQTVGDLIGRIGATAKMELYADHRYEKRSVILLGPKAAPAKDLLRAMALCVGGAYRQVGPAFVLTEDVSGVEVQRMRLVRFAQEADIARHAALAGVNDKLILVHGGVSGLPSLDSGLGLSDAQKALVGRPGQMNTLGQGVNLTVLWSQLTPQQQDFARRQVQQWNEAHPAPTSPQDLGRVTLNGKFGLTTQTKLQLKSPRVSSPVDLQVSDLYQLFQPSSKLQQKLWEEQSKRNAAAPTAAPPPPAAPPAPAGPPLKALLNPIPRRAAIVRARTADEVNSVIASMKSLGLNQLWLEVFWGGKSFIDARPPDGKPDILTEALVRTKGTGIVVLPTLELLRWGLDAPKDARDLTLMGETSAQAQDRRQRYSNIVFQDMTAEESDKQPRQDWLFTCPAAPSVQKTLTDILRRLAATPGVPALALRETTVMDGYGYLADSASQPSEDSLGYVPALRLALLRRDHVDPVDLEPNLSIPGMNIDMSLPEFDNRTALGTADRDWNEVRYDANRDFMQRLLVIAQQAAGRRIPFLVKQRRFSGAVNWYGLWDDPRAPLPEMSEAMEHTLADPNMNFAPFAHTQSRTDMVEFTGWSVQSKEGLVSSLQQMKPGWDGIVLDFSADPFGNPNGERLPDLAKSLTPATPEPRNGKNAQK